MNDPENNSTETIAFELKIDSVCDRFESAWMTGQPVTIEQILDSWPGDEQTRLLEELLPIEIFHRRRRGESWHSDEYKQRFPRLDKELLTRLTSNAEPADTHGDESKAHSSLQDTAGHSQGGSVASLEVTTKLPNVPGYEILGEVGRGATGIVYLARQLVLGRRVALKMVLAGGQAGRETLARFKSEAAALARIPHPNIIQVFDCGEHEGCPFLSLELIEGGTLATQTAGVPQPPRNAARLIETLARAVHHAHQAGIVHRDLKPANVLITPNGVCKLTDFGLAKLEQASHAATATTMLLGTPRYMAPEQAAGQTQVGPAADIYALGVILYELVTGRPPFQSGSLKELLHAICHQEPIALRLLKATTPHDLETICLKCLEKSPDDRYRSAEELADDLQRFLSDRPIHARPIGSLEIFSRWCRRNPAVATVSATLLTVLLVTTIASVIFANSYKSISDQSKLHASIADEATEKSRKLALETRMQLARSLINEARMLRRSGRPGQFTDAKAKILEARECLQYLGQQGFLFDHSVWTELRKEATSVFLVPDIILAQAWKTNAPDFPSLTPSLDRRIYVRWNQPGTRLAVCHFGSDDPVFEIDQSNKHPVNSADFSGDGKYLWTSSIIETCVWEVGRDHARLVRTFPWAADVCLSHDGSVVARYMDGDRTEFHAVTSGELLAETDVGRLLFGIPLHPSRPWAAIGKDSSLDIYDYRSRQVVWSFPTLIQSAHWSADGRWLATSTIDGQVRLHAYHSGEILIDKITLADAGGVDAVPDVTHGSLFTTDWSGSLRWYDASSGIAKLKISSSYAERLRIASEGKLLGLLSNGQRYSVYTPRSGRLREFGVGSSRFSVLSHNGRWWATRHNGGLGLFHVPSGERLAVLGEPYAAYPLAFSVDDTELFAYGDGLQRIRLTFKDSADPQLVMGRPEVLFADNTLEDWGCAQAADIIAVPAHDAGTTLYHRSLSDPKAWDILRTPGQNDVRFAEVSPDGQWLVAGSHVRGEIAVYSARTGKLHKELLREGGIPKFSPDGRWLGIAKFAGGIELFATDGWDHRGSLPGQHLAFSDDGRLLALGTDLSTVTLMATDTLRPVTEFEIQDQTRIIPIAFTPDTCGLLATTVEGRRSMYFDLYGMRQDLRELGMDWDWPALSPKSIENYAIPRVVVDVKP